jgi:hypothetical protein
MTFIFASLSWRFRFIASGAPVYRGQGTLFSPPFPIRIPSRRIIRYPWAQVDESPVAPPITTYIHASSFPYLLSSVPCNLTNRFISIHGPVFFFSAALPCFHLYSHGIANANTTSFSPSIEDCYQPGGCAAAFLTIYGYRRHQQRPFMRPNPQRSTISTQSPSSTPPDRLVGLR